MLRVGLTGGLGSGKSTVASMLRAYGAHILVSDDIARELMQPGQPLSAAIVERFGPEVLHSAATQGGAPGATPELDRSALARLAFDAGRVEELNAIVHPAVIARQAQLATAIARQDSHAVIVIESALIFETRHAGPGGWHTRFDRIVLVTAPEALRIARFVEHGSRSADPTSRREALAADARRRIARQLPDTAKILRSDFVIQNTGTLAELQRQVNILWPKLQHQALSS